jgi:hypothetical protein
MFLRQSSAVRSRSLQPSDASFKEIIDLDLKPFVTVLSSGPFPGIKPTFDALVRIPKPG